MHSGIAQKAVVAYLQGVVLEADMGIDVCDIGSEVARHIALADFGVYEEVRSAVIVYDGYIAQLNVLEGDGKVIRAVRAFRSLPEMVVNDSFFAVGQAELCIGEDDTCNRVIFFQEVEDVEEQAYVFSL